MKKLNIYALIMTILFVSCSKDDDPVAVNEEEVITTLTVTLVPSDASANIILKTQDLDGDGPNAPVVTVTGGDLKASLTYAGSMKFENETETPAENITLEIIAPDIEFRGDTFYKLSSLEKQTPYTISAELITPVENVTTEYTIPVKVILTYTDDLGETNTSTQSMPLLLRPKTFMELTNDGGIWIGDFFIAPYVSIGTIVGIPAGTILSLIIRRSQNKKKESSTK